MTSVHKELPFSSPPSGLLSQTLAQPSYFDDKSTSSGFGSFRPPSHGSHKSLKPAGSPSVATLSTFSSIGDLLPDEMEDETLTSPITAPVHKTDDVQLIADMIARQRGLPVEFLLPQVLALYKGPDDTDTGNEQSNGAQRSISSLLKDVCRFDGETLKHRPEPLTAIVKHTGEILSSTAPTYERRRFSFELGDDSSHDLLFPSHQSVPSVPTRSHSSPFRRKMSPAQLPEVYPTSKSSPLGTATNVQPSPTSPVFPRSPLLSKIPSPAFDSSLARPRREESTSSLVTTIKHSHRSTSSESSSQKGAMSPALSDAGAVRSRPLSKRSSSDSGKLAGAHRLTEQKNALRGSNLAIAAARAAGTMSRNPSANDLRGLRHGKQPSTQSSNSGQSRFSQILIEAEETHKENAAQPSLPLKDERHGS